jgi:hypothetical protein
MGTGSFPGVKSGRGVTLTPHHLLVPRSRKGRAIPLLPLWAGRPVQSLSACTRVHFTFTLYCDYSALPVQYWASHVVCSLCVLRCKISAQLIRCITNQIKCISASFRQFNAFFKQKFGFLNPLHSHYYLPSLQRSSGQFIFETYLRQAGSMG